MYNKCKNITLCKYLHSVGIPTGNGLVNQKHGGSESPTNIYLWVWVPTLEHLCQDLDLWVFIQVSLGQVWVRHRSTQCQSLLLSIHSCYSLFSTLTSNGQLLFSNTPIATTIPLEPEKINIMFFHNMSCSD